MSSLPTSVPTDGFSVSGLFQRFCVRLQGDPALGTTRRNALVAFGLRIASAAILYVSQIVLARWMGAFEYGIFVAVWTWLLVLGGVSQLGFSTVMMRQVPVYVETGQWSLLRGILRGGRLLAIGTGTAVALVGLAGLYAFGSRLEAPLLMPAYLALVCIPMFALSDVQDGIGRGRGWLVVALAPPYVLRPLLVLASMGAARAVGLPMTASTAGGAAIFASWLAVIVQALLLQRRIAETVPAAPRTFAFRAWSRMAAPFLTIYAAELVLQNADVLLLAMYRGPADVGMYYAAAKSMALVMFIHYSVGSAFAHRFAALSAKGDRDGLAALVGDAVRLTFWPSLLAAGAILALGPLLLRAFSPEFASAYPVMFVLAVGYLIRAAMGPADFLLNMLGEQKRCAVVAGGAAVVNVVLGLVLTPRFGLLGAAAATSIAISLAAIANAAVARRRLGLRLSILENLRWRASTKA